MLPQTLKRVRFLLTSLCSAKCPYCHNEGQGQCVADGFPVNGDRMRRCLDLLAQLGFTPDEVIVSGGEPTLSPHLLEIVRILKNRGIYVSMNTHAGHWERLRPVLPLVNELKVNIDCLDKDTYESIKRLPFEATIHNLLRAVEIVPDVKINCPFTDLKSAGRLIAFCQDHRIGIKFMEILNHHNPLRTAALQIKALFPLLTARGYSKVNTDFGKTRWRHPEYDRHAVVTMQTLCNRAANLQHPLKARNLCLNQTDTIYIDSKWCLRPCLYQPTGISILPALENSDFPMFERIVRQFLQLSAFGPCQKTVQPNLSRRSSCNDISA